MKLGIYVKPLGRLLQVLLFLIKCLVSILVKLYTIRFHNQLRSYIQQKFNLPMSRQARSLKSLLEMGCNSYLCAAAIKNCDNKNFRTLLQWIVAQAGHEQKWKKWVQDQKIGEHADNGGFNYLVNEKMGKQIMSMGYSKAVAEKSLLLTNNISTQSALEWIHEHKNDQDFEKQFIFESQRVPQSNFTNEAAKQKLHQLISKASQIKNKRDQEQKAERQINIKRYGRPTVWAKTIAQEQSLRTQLQLYKTQNKKDIECQAKLLQSLRNQRIQEPDLKKQINQKFLSQFQLQCKQVEVGMLANPQKAKVLFETVGIYINNILKNGEEKFRKINMDNKAFQTRVVGCFGGVEVLKALGYQEENNYLLMRDFNVIQLSRAVSLLQKYIQSYQ